jgi:3-phosphoglycerate kinase
MNQGKITDDLRITETLKTIDFILRNNPLYLIILSHLGRPNGSKN